MTVTLFLQSMWVGLAIAAPVGPIGVLVIQRTLRHGVPVGLATGLGAAVADAAYGAVAAYGVTGLMAWLQGARLSLALAGGAFLLWLAWRTWFAAPAALDGSATAAPGLASTFAGAVALTLSNPATVLSFIAIFGALAGAGAPEMNPLVNPGAISATSMVKGATADAVWSKIIGAHNDFAGRSLSVLQDVYKSESDSNQRNQAIGRLMLQGAAA